MTQSPSRDDVPDPVRRTTPLWVQVLGTALVVCAAFATLESLRELREPVHLYTAEVNEAARHVRVSAHKLCAEIEAAALAGNADISSLWAGLEKFDNATADLAHAVRDDETSGMAGVSGHPWRQLRRALNTAQIVGKRQQIGTDYMAMALTVGLVIALIVGVMLGLSEQFYNGI